MKNIYEKIYEGDVLNLSNNPRIKIMLNIIDCYDLKNKNILDVGCYNGIFLSLIKNKNNNFYGIEASDYGVQEATRKGIKVKKFFFDDKTKIPLESDFFDVIIAGEIIEHIYDTDLFLDEIHRLLKPNGRLLISSPNLASFGRRLLLLIGRNPIIEVSPNELDSSGHIRYFTFKTLKYLLEKHDFKIISERSDVVNFSNNGKIRSLLLPRAFPTLGQSVIIEGEK